MAWFFGRGRRKPEKQYYGGSQEKYQEYQNAYADMAERGGRQADWATIHSQDAADKADQRYGQLGQDVADFGAAQGDRAKEANQGIGQSMDDYQAGRRGVLNNAAAIERGARNLQSDYQTTADRQFQLNQNRSQRAALATGARGGASGIRQALSSSTMANADAAAQAEITRANEMNQLAQMKQNAYAQAANIRAGQGAQDQSAGQIYAGREQNSYANQAGSYGMRGDIIGQRNAAQQGAAQLEATVGMGHEGNYLGAQTGMETAQLNAAREREAQRQEQGNRAYSRMRDPFGVKGSN